MGARAGYLILLLAGVGSAPLAAQRTSRARGDDARDAPRLWLEAGPELAAGEPARLAYTAPRDGYLTVLRAGTDGGLSVVYPARPNDRSAPLRSGRATHIPLRADAVAGTGYFFSVRSDAPFDFRRYEDLRGGWSLGRLATDADPFEFVDQFARGTARGGYAVAYSSYRVGGEPGYPGHRGYASGRELPRDARARAVHDGYDGEGYQGQDGYGRYGMNGYPYGAPDDVYGWWGGPGWDGYASDTWRYRRGSRDDMRRDAEYWRAEQSDPRSRYLRHCADGTLAPYTVGCGGAPRAPLRRQSAVP